MAADMAQVPHNFQIDIGIEIGLSRLNFMEIFMSLIFSGSLQQKTISSGYQMQSKLCEVCGFSRRIS